TTADSYPSKNKNTGHSNRRLRTSLTVNDHRLQVDGFSGRMEEPIRLFAAVLSEELKMLTPSGFRKISLRLKVDPRKEHPPAYSA
ncbi:MAG TPA: hypothetical protein PK425_11910, partial [Syntrophales bacterium]|nr:hypothetical protein [Syntrophales bacterium]HPX57233.1 hypothetical protein [Syntrophales bacterium]HQA81728.1 hypothetical protein [Syntrophales bacterium]